MSHGRRWERFSNKLAIASMAAMLAGGSAAMAQEAAAPAAPAPNTGAISLSAGMDVVTEYIFRGIPQQDQGLIMQPYASVSAALWSQGDWSLGATVGTWNSVQSNEADGDGLNGWYEADWSFGVDIGMPAGFSGSAYYVILYSPDNGGIFAEEIDLGLSYDDSDLWGDTGIPGWTGLQPYALLAIETDKGSDSATGNTTAVGTGSEGTYLELGINPGCTIVENQDYPVTLNVPMKIGLGLDNYYEHVNSAGNIEDETFGYFDGGLVASVPLSFIPAEYGSWSASAGVHFVVLNNDYINDAVAPNYDQFRIVGTVGISMDY